MEISNFTLERYRLEDILLMKPCYKLFKFKLINNLLIISVIEMCIDAEIIILMNTRLPILCIASFKDRQLCLC